MPIKPENRGRYPADWADVRLQVLQRARYQCEWPGCAAQHHALGYWRAGVFAAVAGPFGRGERSYADARLELLRRQRADMHGLAWVVIVLTVAHLDHMPENCSLNNLKAWCQRHHLAYDKPHHLQTQYMARHANACTAELFPPQPEIHDAS